MGYHPETLAFSFPPYPSGGMSLSKHPKPRSFGRWLYGLSPWIGFDVWHIDPENRVEGQRRDDSCGWFDRRPNEYADAVKYLLNDKDVVHDIERTIACKANVTGPYGQTYPRMSMADTLAVCLMVAQHLELRRWWNGQDGKGGAHASRRLRYFTKERRVDDVATNLALNPIDNLSTAESADGLIRLIAAALSRKFKPWWKHPRWHVHHWQVNFHIVRNVKRMFQKCATCGKAIGFGKSPTVCGNKEHHGDCLGVAMAVQP